MKQKQNIPVRFVYPSGKSNIQFVNQFAFAQIDMDVIMDIGMVDLKDVLELNMKAQSGILQPQDSLEAVVTNRFGMSISSFMKLKQQIDQIFQNLEKQGVLVKKPAPDQVQ